EFDTPSLVFLTPMERENADFERVLGHLRERYGKRLAPLTSPVGSEHSFGGVVELIGRRVFLGDQPPSTAVPSDVADSVETQREALIEAVCEVDDELINKYLEGEALADEEIGSALRQGVLSAQLVPVLCASPTG